MRFTDLSEDKETSCNQAGKAMCS